jgi:hypothetical protein
VLNLETWGGNLCDQFFKCYEIGVPADSSLWRRDTSLLGKWLLTFWKIVSHWYVRIEQSKKNFQIFFCIQLYLLLFLEYYVAVTKKINCCNLICIRDINVCLGMKAFYENLSWHPYEWSYVNCVNSGNCCIIPIQMRNCPICVLCVSTVILIHCRYASLITPWLRYRTVVLYVIILPFFLKYIKKHFKWKFYCVFSSIYQSF